MFSSKTTVQMTTSIIAMDSLDIATKCPNMNMQLADCSQMLDDACKEKCANSHCTQILVFPAPFIASSFPAYSNKLIEIVNPFSTRSISPDTPPPLT